MRWSTCRKGVGGELQHYARTGQRRRAADPAGQQRHARLLGTRRAGPLPWQVVGYAGALRARTGDDDQSFWREYLLYHRSGEGFAFLVDAEDGWSWTAPITGCPSAPATSAVKYQGTATAAVRLHRQGDHVLGEFYWRLERDALTHNTDYQGTGSAAAKRLNRERTGAPGAAAAPREITGRPARRCRPRWAEGLVQPGADKMAGRWRRDTCRPPATRRRCWSLLFWGFALAVVLVMFRCDNDECADLRSTARPRPSTRAACATAAAAAAAGAPAAARTAAIPVAAATSDHPVSRGEFPCSASNG